MSQSPVIAIEATDRAEFEVRCATAIADGYRVSSTACGFVDSAEYNFCSHYQAILVLPSALVGGLEPVTEISSFEIPPHQHPHTHERRRRTGVAIR